MQKVKDKPFLEALGVRVKEVRKQKNLSQLELAVLMNNHPEQISRIERGVLNVTICTMKKIADSLDIDISDLLPGRDN